MSVLPVSEIPYRATQRIQRKMRAAENVRRMKIRTLIYKLMVLGPFLLIAGIAISARLRYDPYNVTGCSPVQQDAISAYLGPVKLANNILETNGLPNSATELRSVADGWIAGSESGELKALLPAFYDDSMRSPIKSQIKSACDKVLYTLIRLGESEGDAGHAHEAAFDLVRALKMSEVLKYSDPYAVAVYGMSERDVLTKLLRVAPKLSESDRALVSRSLKGVRDRQNSVRELAQLTKAQYTAWCETKHIKPLQIESFQKDLLVDPTAVADAKVFLVKDTMMASNQDKIPPFYPEIKLDYESQHRLSQMFGQAILKLSLAR